MKTYIDEFDPYSALVPQCAARADISETWTKFSGRGNAFATTATDLESINVNIACVPASEQYLRMVYSIWIEWK